MTGMVPEDVFELTGVTDPRLSPDGKTVAYVVGGVDAKANDDRGAIGWRRRTAAGEPVQLVRFPEESHELTRAGSPAHRVQRFRIVLKWFDRYLKD